MTLTQRYGLILKHKLNRPFIRRNSQLNMWYVKKLSKLSQVSVRTLHYYDKIGLLKPSGRAPNGYRVYSETDLITLKKVIAFKFFGFTLIQIHLLLRNDVDILKLLRAQLKLLREEISHLEHAQKKLLTLAIHELEEKRILDWHKLVDLIQLHDKEEKLIRNQVNQAFLEEQLKLEEHDLSAPFPHKSSRKRVTSF